MRGGAHSSTLPVSALEDHVGFWLRFVSNHVSSRFRGLVEANGVTVSEWVALRQLYHSEQPSSPRALIEALGMTKGAVSKVLDRLERKGLAERRSDPEDGRAQGVLLTAKGRRWVPRLAALADENDAHFFDALAPAARRELTSILRELVRVHALKQVPTE